MNAPAQRQIESATARRRANEADARAALAPLLALEPNWDSYGGLPLAPDVAQAGFDLLVDLREAGRPDAFVVPTSPGGLSLEWYGPGIDLAITLDPADPPEISVYFIDETAGEEWETGLDDARSRLPSAFARLIRASEQSRPRAPGRRRAPEGGAMSAKTVIAYCEPTWTNTRFDHDEEDAAT